MALGLEQILQGYGCRIVGPVPRLAEALALAEREPLDGAILDVNLRGQPVFPVVEALLARGVPLIFCSGYAETGFLPEAYRHLPRLAKPYDEPTLRRAMTAAFVAGAERATPPAPARAAGS